MKNSTLFFGATNPSTAPKQGPETSLKRGQLLELGTSSNKAIVDKARYSKFVAKELVRIRAPTIEVPQLTHLSSLHRLFLANAQIPQLLYHPKDQFLMHIPWLLVHLQAWPLMPMQTQ
jgi:hypothetical protein